MIEPGTLEDRAVGALVGLAVGDALGTSVEFRPRGSFTPVTGMRGGGAFNMPVGGWTDDTSMALALGEALLQDRTLSDASTLMNNWLSWWQHGHFSHTGDCFDIGNQTASALGTWRDHGTFPEHEGWSAGNGGIMRLAPAVLAHLDTMAAAVHIAQRQSDLTHRNATCRSIAADLATCLFRLIHAETVEIVSPMIASRALADVKSTGYVLDTFEAALWAFAPADGFAAIVLRAVNLGDDADTVGAVAGQIAGAHYGMSGIPTEWLDALIWRDDIIDLGRRLYRLSQER
ncbi:ADP-ribosylation/Crystallin J1 [Acidocella sp. MX-AZ02]|nr:ADP-ribosylation/Crystallin J1 [Acidocella sp. MX-AZ02]